MTWKFERLGLEHTRILFLREFDEGEELSPRDIDRCLATGRSLAANNIELSAVFSSPTGAAFGTAIEVMRGLKRIYRIESDDRFDNLKARYPDIVKVAKAEGISLYQPDSFALEAMQTSGAEGAEALQEIAKKYISGTVLVVSHGEVRMENTLMVLRGEPVQEPAKFIAKGQIVELIFDKTGELLLENWLEPIK